jgi:hypothetical protein
VGEVSSIRPHDMLYAVSAALYAQLVQRCEQSLDFQKAAYEWFQTCASFYTHVRIAAWSPRHAHLCTLM